MTRVTEKPRDCQRLLAIVASKSSADSLDTQELLHLADWLAAPLPEERTRDWAEHVAIPIVAELGRRLQRSLDSQAIDMPALLLRVRELRSAQRKYLKAPPAQRRELAERAQALESEIDELLSLELQPSLFADNMAEAG